MTTALSGAISAAIGPGPQPQLVTKDAAKAIMSAANADGIRTQQEEDQLSLLIRDQWNRFGTDFMGGPAEVFTSNEYVTIGLNKATLKAAANGPVPNVIDASEADAIIQGAIRFEGDLCPEERELLQNLIATAGGPAGPDSGLVVTAEAGQRLAQLMEQNRARWTFPSGS